MFDTCARRWAPARRRTAGQATVTVPIPSPASPLERIPRPRRSREILQANWSRGRVPRNSATVATATIGNTTQLTMSQP